MRQTKIVATIGPASDDSELLVQLIKAGIDVARLNFSHGNHSEQQARFERIRAAAKVTDKFVPIILDTKGPELRLGRFASGPVMLTAGQSFALYAEERLGDLQGASISWPTLANEVAIGDRILIDDGLVELKVVTKQDQDAHCQVIIGGMISDRKGVNIPGRSINMPALSEQDVADIKLGVELGVDFIAQSFVRGSADVLALRRLLEDLEADIPIIAKIENQQGVAHLREILDVADGIMVARGDLGVEIPAEEVPLIQKQLIATCNRIGKPVITATQMLESMIRSPRPTRAEASDVANAIFDGTDAIMLSGETATGSYPLEAVQTMARIAVHTEQALDYKNLSLRQLNDKSPNVTDAISHATVQAAADLRAAAIITSTESGSTARMVSRYRPQTPIIAFTTDAKVARRLNLSWGVHPTLGRRVTSTDEMISAAIARALDLELIRNGDLIVLTAGVPVGVPGTTNLIKVHIVGDVLARGVGIGKSSVTGNVITSKTAQEAVQKMIPGSIVVAIGTDRGYIPVLEQAAGLVTEEGGLTSHGAVVALSLGLPVIVGVPGATSLLVDGQLVTLDVTRGLIYRGATHIPS
jgi:pyruvate kinase